MRLVGVWMLVVGLVARAGAEPPTEALAYAVLGVARTTVGAKARVQGDVGCMSNELALGPGTRIGGSAAAPSITTGRGTRAAGGYFCSLLDESPDGCMALPNPLVATPTIVVVGPPSNSDVSAAKRTKSTTPLAPGAYGTLTVGTAAEMALAGGSYQFESISLGARARLLCRAACDVTVRGRVELGQAARLGAADGVVPEAVVLRIAGQGETTAFAAKSRASVRGSVYAPSAGVTLGQTVKVTGALVGDTVTVGARARLQGLTVAP